MIILVKLNKGYNFFFQKCRRVKLGNLDSIQFIRRIIFLKFLNKQMLLFKNNIRENILKNHLLYSYTSYTTHSSMINDFIVKISRLCYTKIQTFWRKRYLFNLVNITTFNIILSLPWCIGAVCTVSVIARCHQFQKGLILVSINIYFTVKWWY